MTRRGIGYIVILALLVIFAFGTGIHELHMITFCMLLLFAFSLLSSLLAAISLKVSSTISEQETYRREVLTFDVRIKGFVFLPIAGDVYVAVPGKLRRRVKDAENHVFYRLPGICKKTFSFKLKCDHKGLWYVGIKKLRVHDVFGLFSFPLFFSAAETKRRYEIKVHPAVYLPDTERLNPPSKIGVSVATTKESEAGDSVTGSRQYQFGDPFKRINWKQTVRTQKVYVRNYELEQNPQVLVLIDAGSSRSPRNNSEIAADIAVSLNSYYMASNCAIRNIIIRLDQKGFASELENSVKSSSDFIAFDQMLMTSKTFAYNPEPLNIPLLDTAIFSNANIIHVISPDPSVELLTALASLEQQDYTVTCLVPLANEAMSGIIKERASNSGFTPTVIYEPSDIIRTLGGRL